MRLFLTILAVLTAGTILAMLFGTIGWVALAVMSAVTAGQIIAKRTEKL